MLLRNYRVYTQLCGHNHSGAPCPVQFIQPHVMRGFYTRAENVNNETDLQINKNNIPSGGYIPAVLILSDKGGAISASTTLFQSNGFTNLNLAGGLNGDSILDGTSTLIGELGALAFLITTLDGTNTLSADIQGAVNIAATLAGNGDLTGALGALISILADLNGNGDLTGDIAGALSAVATLTGTGDLTGAIQGVVEIIASLDGTSAFTSSIIGNWDMLSSIAGSNTLSIDATAFAHILSDLSGSGTISLTSGAVSGDMNCLITSCSDLSPDSLAAAVWNSLAASFDNAGTMGEKLNDAGSASNPWTEVIEGGYTAAEILRLLAAVAAGKSTIVDLGGGLATVTFRDINDTTNRVIADMQDSERITVTKNL